MALSDAGWDTELAGGGDLPLLVDFWAPGCVPCRRVSPLVRAFGARHAERVRLGTLDVDRNPVSAARHGVLSLPTLILFRAGRPVARLAGAISAERLERTMTPHLPSAPAAR